MITLGLVLIAIIFTLDDLDDESHAVVDGGGL